MESAQEPNYQRYRCTRNPFIHYPINPLARPEDADLLVGIDGFRQVCGSGGRITATLKKAVDLGLPAYFLICGGSWTGKKAAAWYIMDQYRSMRLIPQDRFIVPFERVSDFAVTEFFQQWLLFLRNELRSTYTLEKFDVDFFQSVHTFTAVTLTPEASGYLRHLSERLAAEPRAGFGAILYGELSAELAETAFTIFARSQTVSVFLSPDQRASEARRWFAADPNAMAEVLDLEPLEPQEVGDLARERWNRLGPKDVKPPFDLQHLVRAMEGKRRSVGRALRVLHDLIDKKLKECPEGEPWPNAPDLEFTEPELKADIPFLERYHERP
jgi:hypothetical protein